MMVMVLVEVLEVAEGTEKEDRVCVEQRSVGERLADLESFAGQSPRAVRANRVCKLGSSKARGSSSILHR